MLEDIIREYHFKNPTKKLAVPGYFEKAIRTKLEVVNHSARPQKRRKESMSKRGERLVQEGKVVLQEEHR